MKARSQTPDGHSVVTFDGSQSYGSYMRRLGESQSSEENSERRPRPWRQKPAIARERRKPPLDRRPRKPPWRRRISPSIERRARRVPARPQQSPIEDKGDQPIVIPSTCDGRSKTFPLVMPKELAYAQVDPRDYLKHVVNLHYVLRPLKFGPVLLVLIGIALAVAQFVMMKVWDEDTLFPSIALAVASVASLLAAVLLFCENKKGRLVRAQKYCEFVTTAGLQWHFAVDDAALATGNVKQMTYYLVMMKV